MMRSNIIFLLLAFTSTCYGLSCLPCANVTCAAVQCRTKVVKDVCGCCDVCSKALGESCGGPWNIAGLCDDGLKCMKSVRPGDLAFNVEGICAPNNTKNCEFPTKFTTCASACQARCDERQPLICTLQCIENPCVCAEGYIRKSATNDTCVPIEHCPPTTTCEFPKVYKECATACPSTCDKPFPSICTKNCNLDPCVCPEGYMMKSLTDRRCIKDYECQDFSFCQKNCLPMLIGASPCDMAGGWVCQMANWKCNAYEWRMEMAKWWVENDCSNNDEGLWKMFNEIIGECPTPLACKNLGQTECDVDGFGCWACTCRDGQYADMTALTAMSSRNQARYLELMNVYRSVRQRCQGSTRC